MQKSLRTNTAPLNYVTMEQILADQKSEEQEQEQKTEAYAIYILWCLKNGILPPSDRSSGRVTASSS